MELYQLRSFAAVAEAGHLTRAAEKLHISQPALSAQIKALEDELQAVLFDRTSSGMVLTAAGKRLLEEAEKVLAAVQALRNEARSLQGEVTGKLRIGTLYDPEFIRLGEFLAAAVERHPLLELELHQDISRAAFDKVRHGELDASFYYGELFHPEVAGLRLREVVYRVAAPAAWEARIREAGWDEIAAQPWIIPPAISTHHHLAFALFREYGVEPSRVIEADNEGIVGALVASGLGMALLREEVAREKAAAGEICVWNDVRVNTTLWFVYLGEREQDPVIRALLDVLKDTWGLEGHRAKPGRRNPPARRRRPD
jgi:DNA-binding transcriptional LysR family regulator